MATEELQHALQRVSGTALDAQGACNVWIGNPSPNPQLELLGCLNVKAGTTGLDLLAVLNLLAGTTGLDVNGAAAEISTDEINDLMTEAGAVLITESGDTLIMEF